jgi:hypothetical protein
MHSVPPIEAPHVQAFCAEISSISQPQLVVCRPRFDRPANACFPIVEEQIAINGGAMLIGWAIWEWPGLFIEAEFHATWVSPTGVVVDLNPRQIFTPSIVFLPDPTRRYEGKQVDNIRKPLIRDNDLIRFLFTCRRKFEILNKGELAYQHGLISLPPKTIREVQLLQKESTRLQQRLHNRYKEGS